MDRTLRYTIVGECWEFAGAINQYGYGRTRKTEGESIAHRLMYKRTHDDFNKELLVRHTCDNRACINPEHLIQGTYQDNMDDKMKRGRWRGRELITREVYEDMKGLLVLGWTQQKIADFYGVSNQAVSKRLKEWG